ncbi:uncharacterized protein LOC106012019 [Aplysia californica]|uniref:Uncharacterized protein LOC106012019 n=1 Tax=Aplysia californica TaxID=6500 RepID=A0ABM1A1R4_APLCA|nr:uncharacterized protein LOC106012019 [Aplysia californica]
MLWYTAIVLLFLAVPTHGLTVFTSDDDVTECSVEAPCEDAEEMCRKVQECIVASCPVTSYCLECVPQGVDSRCINAQYQYAVLVGSALDPVGLRDRPCDQENNRCPDGATCVFDVADSDVGVCCYGSLDASSPGNTPSDDSDDDFCSIPEDSHCGSCDAGHICKRVLENDDDDDGDDDDDDDDSDSEEADYECREIVNDGYCPSPLFVGTPIDCPPGGSDISCRGDHDCSETDKCCLNICGGRQCTTSSDE